MRRYAVLAAVAAFLAASLALGQWSEPVWLDTAVTVLVNLPVLIPGQSDTTWSVWSTEYAPMTSELWAGKVVGDSLVSRELVHQDGERLIYAFDGLVEPSGDLRVVYYAGQYETGIDDPWDCAVLCSERSENRWAEPETVFKVTLLPGLDTIPFHIAIGLDRSDSVAIVWEQEMGVMGAVSWLDYIHLRDGEWTGRRCLGPMSPPDTVYSGGSLVPGRNSDFLLAFSRPMRPAAGSVEVWTLADSLVERQVAFIGSSPALARSGPSDFLTFIRNDSVYVSIRDSSGWGAPTPIPTHQSILHAPRLHVDPFGVVWACWVEEGQDKVIVASHNAGGGWSIPETVAVAVGCWGAGPEIASSTTGEVRVAWFEDLRVSYGLRTSRRLARPAIDGADQSRLDIPPAGPTVVRGVLWLAPASSPKLQAPCSLIDISGRKVMELRPGANDVRHLVPGVYFIRKHGSANERLAPAAAHKVVVQR